MIMVTHSDDDIALLDAIRRYAAEVLAPAAAEIDETGRSATMHLDSLAEMGLMGPVQVGPGARAEHAHSH